MGVELRLDSKLPQEDQTTVIPWKYRFLNEAQFVHPSAGKNEPVFVIVSWTFPGRYEFKLNNSWTTITSWTVGKQFEDDDHKHLNTIVDKFKHDAKQNGIYDFATAFFKHVGFTEYWEIYSTLKEIVYLQNYLKVNNIPYMFTAANVDFLSSYTLSNPDASITSLHNQIEFDRWFFFPDQKGFHTWALDNKYAIGDTHPLESAHYDAAELIRSKFNELVTQYNQQNQTRN